MANIDLERKGRGGAWGWIIAIIIVLIILWAIFGHRATPARTAQVRSVPAVLEPAGAATLAWMHGARTPLPVRRAG